jgi:hypothetical protein
MMIPTTNNTSAISGGDEARCGSGKRTIHLSYYLNTVIL